jgi:hypothetical protein
MFEGRFYSNNPEKDYDRWLEANERWLESRPVCKWCGEHIQEEHAYQVGDDLVCESCMEGEKVNVDDFMEARGWNSDY